MMKRNLASGRRRVAGGAVAVGRGFPGEPCYGVLRRGAWRSLVSALVWGTRGPEFKSRRPDSKAAAEADFSMARAAPRSGAPPPPLEGRPPVQGRGPPRG